MFTRPLGQSGIEASVIGLGTWAMGGWLWGGTDQDAAVRAIRASLASGINLIDTAPAYGLGLSEELVGKAIVGRREQAVIATKCGLVWHTTRGQYFVAQDGKAVYRYLGRDSIFYECDQSLRRLGTDHIDLYQTHWQDPTTPIEETMGALLELKRQGKIRAIGVSNVTIGQLSEYLRLGAVDTDQERYSLLDRKHESELLPFCRTHGIPVLAYSPLAHGLLTGRLSPDREFPPGDLRRDNPRFSAEARRDVAQRLDRVRPVAELYGLTMAQLMIAWTLAQPGITHALVGARDERQAGENAAAGNLTVAAKDLISIEEAFRPVAGGVA